ncbi:MAG: hypothetical protein KIS94_05680 [Chitinophagales bacterium]|nr:hypothetical protein [Chitinophagales bacterium]
MQLQVNKATVKAFATVCSYGYTQPWALVPIQNFVRSACERLIPKLSRLYRKISQPRALHGRKKPRKLPETVSLKLNDQDALLLYFCIEVFAADFPQSLETLLCKEHFLNEINQLQS